VVNADLCTKRLKCIPTCHTEDYVQDAIRRKADSVSRLFAPDVAQATALVNNVMAKYNVTVTEMPKEARSRE
jgi:hypothetical protein